MQCNLTILINLAHKKQQIKRISILKRKQNLNILFLSQEFIRRKRKLIKFQITFQHSQIQDYLCAMVDSLAAYNRNPQQSAVIKSHTNFTSERFKENSHMINTIKTIYKFNQLYGNQVNYVKRLINWGFGEYP